MNPTSPPPSSIIHKISPKNLIIALAMVLAGIGLIILNLTPNAAGYIRVSLPLLGFEALLIIGGISLFIKGLKTEFCAECNQALVRESRTYALEDENKILQFAQKQDKEALQSAQLLTNSPLEKHVELEMKYCKKCHNTGHMKITRLDEDEKLTILLKDYPLNKNYFDLT